jgi:hypothetical protein
VAGGGTSCQGSFTNNNGVPLELLAFSPPSKGVYEMAAPAYSAPQQSNNCYPAALDDTCDPLYSGPFPGQGENTPVEAEFNLDVSNLSGSTPVSVNKSWTCTSSDGQTTDTGSIQWSGTVTIGCSTVVGGLRLPATVRRARARAAAGACGVAVQPSRTTVTLLQLETLRAILTPKSAAASSFRFEIKRPSEAGWTLLGTTKTPGWSYRTRVAGHFDVRVTATVQGAQVVSAPKEIEVRFPSGRSIARNGSTVGFAGTAWRLTLAVNRPADRREVGFFITLDTCDRTYGHTSIIVGPPAPNNPAPGVDDTAGVVLGAVPPDVPAHPADTGCATYPVADFHTHTPTTYRAGHFTRDVGPSQGDIDSSATDGLPGIVDDYIAFPRGGNSVPFGYPANSPTKLYTNPPTRRLTPT